MTTHAVVAEDDIVTPIREGRATDLSKGVLPVQFLIPLILAVVSIIGSVYGMTSGIRESQLKMESDLRDVKTRMELQRDVVSAQNETRALEMKAQNEAINELKRLTTLLQMQYAELQKRVR